LAVGWVSGWEWPPGPIHHFSQQTFAVWPWGSFLPPGKALDWSPRGLGVLPPFLRRGPIQFRCFARFGKIWRFLDTPQDCFPPLAPGVHGGFESFLGQRAGLSFPNFFFSPSFGNWVLLGKLPGGTIFWGAPVLPGFISPRGGVPSSPRGNIKKIRGGNCPPSGGGPAKKKFGRGETAPQQCFSPGERSPHRGANHKEASLF